MGTVSASWALFHTPTPMLSRLALLSLLVLLAPRATAQTAPPATLSDSVRQRLQVELRELMRTDQRVRLMHEFGVFSPCVADSLHDAMRHLSTEDHIAETMALRAEAAARTSAVEKEILLRNMADADRSMLTRLQAIIAEHGWPSDERTGADVDPVVFLLHVPQAIDEMTPTLLAEVHAGRLPAREFALAFDKSRKVRGDLQLYGTGDEYDPATQTIVPPRIEDIEATNAARAEIGLAPLERYRLASD